MSSGVRSGGQETDSLQEDDFGGDLDFEGMSNDAKLSMFLSKLAVNERKVG